MNLLLNKKQQQISELSKRQLSDEDTSKLESLQSTLLQLRTAQNRVTELESKLEKTQEKWSLALGNEKTALGAVDDLISKFNKRWLELSNGSIPLGFGEDPDLNGVSVSTSGDTHQVETTKTIAELQHKLNQALEHIRQSEMARDNLKVAIAMNGTLQAKLDEVKAKYAAIRTSQQHTAEAPVQPSSSSTAAIKSRDNSMASVAASAVSEQKAGTAGHSGRTDREKLEKLDRLYRRARKELASMTLSKDSSKSKFERAEKERDSLMDSNVRLLKQMGEKDEMNAKSLSTILHLKNMTEKLTEERDNLEQQAKSASQLALASRLATNAKERIAEEVSKEKKASEDRLHELEKQYNETQIELERVSAEWSEASGKMAVKESELAYAWKRSDELATENEQKREEIRKLVDVVNNAERESRDAKEKLTNVMKSDLAISTGNDGIGDTSYGTTFTAEQLQTQISVLKNRLACPVCHYRDKECIILRCRHMHCKQCVDERISNRSRKCPTCNVKFSENEVGDIWLS